MAAFRVQITKEANVYWHTVLHLRITPLIRVVMIP